MYFASSRHGEMRRYPRPAPVEDDVSGAAAERRPDAPAGKLEVTSFTNLVSD
jgi:hypothetical protein